jgi:hypothetical protein
MYENIRKCAAKACHIFVLSLILSFKFASLRIVSLDLGVMDSLDLDWTQIKADDPE